MNDTTENFFKAWAEWDRQEPNPVFFRLYYDEQGLPVVYSMENLPGTYIEVDQATYAKNSYQVRVINGTLAHIEYANRAMEHVPRIGMIEFQSADMRRRRLLARAISRKGRSALRIRRIRKVLSRDTFCPVKR